MKGKLPYIIPNFRPRNYTSGRKTDIFPKRVGSLCRLFDSSWISGCVCSLDAPKRHGIWFGNGKSAQLWICYIWTEMRRWTWQFQFVKWGIISNSYCSMFWLTLTSSRLKDVNSSNSFWISCSNDVNFKSNFEMRRVSIAAGSLVSSSQIEIYRFVCPGSSSVFLEIWNWTASNVELSRPVVEVFSGRWLSTDISWPRKNTRGCSLPNKLYGF